MLLLNFIRLVSSFHSRKLPNPNIITKLGILGIRIAQEYSSRFDVIDIEKCIYLSGFQTSDTEKEDRHLLTLLPKKVLFCHKWNIMTMTHILIQI